MKDSEPLHYFQWHITHTCNLRCTHCYQEDYCLHTPDEELFRILDMYSEFIAGKKLKPQINLTGGEPLMHPAFFKLASEIKKRGIRLGILTNGTLIDDKAAAEIASLHPVFVQISIDGTREIHDKIRGNGSFDKAVAGIDSLKKYGVKVLVSFTAQKKNYECFEELAKICFAHKVDKLWWDRVVTDSKKTTAGLALTADQFKELVLTAQHLHKKYRRFVLETTVRDGGTVLINGEAHRSYKKSYRMKWKSMVSTSRALQAEKCTGNDCYTCSAGGNLIVVLANGDVMPCRRLPFVIGNVKENSLSEIINGSRLMRDLSLPRFPDGCNGCKRFEFCRGGARCVTYGQTGKLNAKDVNCFYY